MDYKQQRGVGVGHHSTSSWTESKQNNRENVGRNTNMLIRTTWQIKPGTSCTCPQHFYLHVDQLRTQQLFKGAVWETSWVLKRAFSDASCCSILNRKVQFFLWTLVKKQDVKSVSSRLIKGQKNQPVLSHTAELPLIKRQNIWNSAETFASSSKCQIFPLKSNTSLRVTPRTCSWGHVFTLYPISTADFRSLFKALHLHT